MGKREKSRTRRKPAPAAPKGDVQGVRTGKRRVLLLLGLVGAGIVALLIVDPFSRPADPAPDREEHRAVHRPEPPTADALKKETLDVARKVMADFPAQPDPLGLMGKATPNSANRPRPSRGTSARLS